MCGGADNVPEELMHTVLRLPEVKARTGLSRSTIYFRIARGAAAAVGSGLPGKKGSEVMATKKGAVTLGSGNVFKGLGLKNPEELLAKAKLAARIVQILEERKVSQT
jgi:hypothetical protein